MSKICPFRALRPSEESAPRVSSVPYDVVSTDEARALAADNPLSFLHVTRAEIDLPAGTDPYDASVYAKAKSALAGITAAAPLVHEAEPSLYLYRLVMGSHAQTGLAACYSVDEYDNDLIKKHERTRRDKEDDRTRHITTTRAQTGVVFLTYRASAEIDAVAAEVAADAPLYDFTSEDGIRHTVWKVTGEPMHRLVAGFDRLPCLYIADGHHRAASAARTRAKLRDEGASVDAPVGDWNRFLAVAFPHDQMQVLPYHRVVRDLRGSGPAEFLARLAEHVKVLPGPPIPARKGLVGMYLAGRWYTLELPPAADGSTYAGLDVARLQETVLTPLLGIEDPRTDKRIDFVGGIRGTRELERRVDSEEMAVAFAMVPVSVEDLMAIADEGGIMPPKSTWFEPKLRDGLLVHQF
ncbi:MAG: DUF1015 domain-containing protein [Holophagales bacterium]|nr:MAG: DUF1015 domain-containing protein [Holophagales bacterium]